MRRSTGSAAWLAAAAIASGAAQAADRPLWELGAGLGVLDLPHYRGADQRHTWVLPVPYVVYRGEIFKADRDGARAVLYESSRVDFDLSAGASAPTRSDDNAARSGMEDLAPTVELGPNMNLTLARSTGWKLDLRLPVRAAVTVERHVKGIGWAASPNLNLDLAVNGGWRVGLQAAAVFNDARYTRYYYGVPDADATATRPAYRAGGGYGGLQFTGAVSRRFERVWAGAFVRYDSLAGAVFDDSPLVRQRRQWSAGFAVSYVFAASTRTVSSAE